MPCKREEDLVVFAVCYPFKYVFKGISHFEFIAIIGRLESRWCTLHRIHWIESHINIICILGKFKNERFIFAALILISESSCRLTLNNLLFGACSSVTEVGVEAVLKKCRRLRFMAMPNRVTWSDLEKIVIAVLGEKLLAPTPFPEYFSNTDPVDDMDSKPDFGMSRYFPFANIKPFDCKLRYVWSNY